METVNLLALDSCPYHPCRLGVQCTPGTSLSNYRPYTSAKLIDVMKVYVTCIAYLSSATNESWHGHSYKMCCTYGQPGIKFSCQSLI